MDRASTARVADRRGSVRFQVLGSLRGTLMVHQTFATRNLSAGGVLVESRQPLTPSSRHTIELDTGDWALVLQARVVRTSLWDGMACKTALEFVDAPAAMAEHWQRLSRSHLPSALAPHDRERRRFPRTPIAGVARLSMFVDASVVDLSATGAFIKCSCPLHVGDAAQIRTALGGQAFVTWASVVRLAGNGAKHDGHDGLGVSFARQSQGAAAALNRFLAQSR